MKRAPVETVAGTGEEHASLELLYRRHHDWLLGRLRRRFGCDVAEDLAQETYLRAAAYQDREVRSPRGLLLRIATHAAFDLERRRRVREAMWQDAERAPEGRGEVWQAEPILLKQVILACRRSSGRSSCSAGSRG